MTSVPRLVVTFARILLEPCQYFANVSPIRTVVVPFFRSKKFFRKRQQPPKSRLNLESGFTHYFSSHVARCSTIHAERGSSSRFLKQSVAGGVLTTFLAGCFTLYRILLPWRADGMYSIEVIVTEFIGESLMTFPFRAV